MSHSSRKCKIGVFVVVSLTVLIITLFLFGAFNIFKTRISCMTIVKSSVQGLAKGAKVKYNGVPIGEIDSIKISQRGEYVYIYMSIFPETLHYVEEGSKNQKESFKSFIEYGIKKGLRCQLRYEGITGTLYQEIQFFEKPLTINAEKALPSEHPIFIPSVPPVLFGNILGKINNSLAKLSAMDKTFKEVNEVLVKINTFLGDQKINTIFGDIERIAKNLNNMSKKIDTAITEAKLNKITSQIVTTLEEAKTLIENINENVDRSNIPELSSEARRTLLSAEGLITLLKNYPDSLIWGKPEEKVVPSY